MGVTSEASQACLAGGHPAFLGFIRASHAPEEETVVRRDVGEESEFQGRARTRQS